MKKLLYQLSMVFLIASIFLLGRFIFDFVKPIISFYGFIILLILTFVANYYERKIK
jgi:hypothetical protein